MKRKDDPIKVTDKTRRLNSPDCCVYYLGARNAIATIKIHGDPFEETWIPAKDVVDFVGDCVFLDDTTIYTALRTLEKKKVVEKLPAEGKKRLLAYRLIDFSYYKKVKERMNETETV